MRIFLLLLLTVTVGQAASPSFVVTIHNNSTKTGQVGISRYTTGCSGGANGISVSATNVAPGQSWSYTIPGSYYDSYLDGGQCVYAYVGPSPYEFSVPAPLIGAVNQSIYIGGGPPPETNCLHSFLVKNNSTSTRVFYIAQSLDEIYPDLDVAVPRFTLFPGEQRLLEGSGPCTNDYKIFVYPNFGNPDLEENWLLDIEPEITPDGDTPTNTVPSVVTEVGPTTFDATGGGNIVFSGTNDTQEGFQALYDAITKGFANGSTNVGPDASSGWPEDFPSVDTQDRLDYLAFLQTNGSPYAVTNNWILTPEGKDDFDEAMTLTGPESFEIPTGTEGFWELELIEGLPKFDFSFSQHGLEDVWNMGRALILWGLVITYGVKVMKDIFQICFLVASGVQLRTPRIDIKILGTGGNWGVALAPVIVGFFLVVWAATLLFLTGAQASVLGGIAWTDILFGGPFGTVGGVVAEAIAASAMLVPWLQVVSVASAYLIFLGTKNIVAGGIVTGIKMLVS